MESFLLADVWIRKKMVAVVVARMAMRNDLERARRGRRSKGSMSFLCLGLGELIWGRWIRLRRKRLRNRAWDMS